MNYFEFSRQSFRAVVFPRSSPSIIPGIAKPRPFDAITLLALMVFPEYRSHMEIAVHEVLESFFIRRHVLANIDLALLFDPEMIRRAIGEYEAGFVRRSSHVDFCIVEPADWSPYICIELDGPHHQKPQNHYQKFHDSWKNKIFQRAGIPLVRLIPHRPFRYDEIDKALAFRDDLVSLMKDLSVEP